jgi:hypothetical protein
MNLIQKGYDGVDQIHVVLNRDQYTKVVNEAIKFEGALTAINYLVN